MAYKAFISYSHAADGKLAPAVQSALHRFAKPWYRLRAMRVFRDKTSLSANPALWPSIEKALNESEYFLLLASPEAAESHWVQQEVQYWLSNKPTNKLLLIVTGGKVVWNADGADFDWTQTTALPATLKGVFPEEPLYVNLAWANEEEQLSLRNADFREAITRLAATLHGQSLDEIAGEDVRQHRSVVRVIWFAGITLAGLTIVSATAAYFAVQKSRVAEERRQIAFSRELAAHAVNQAEFGQVDSALLLSKEAYGIGDTLEARNSLLRTLTHSPNLMAFLHDHTSMVTSVVFSPDGKMLASAGADGTIMLWDVASRKRAGALAHPHGTKLAFAPDGQILASAGCAKIVDSGSCAQGEIRLWNATTSQAIGQPLVGHTNYVSSLVFSGDGKILASGSFDGTVILWNVENHERIGEPVTAHNNGVSRLAFAPFGNILASCGRGEVRLWDITTNQPVGQPLQGHKGWVRSIAFSDDGKILASGGQDGTIILWDVESREQIGDPLEAHSNVVTDVAFLPAVPREFSTANILASASYDQTVILWDVTDVEKGKSPQPIGEPLIGHKDRLTSLAVSSDGHTLATGSRDTTVILWDVEPKALGKLISGPVLPAWGVAFSPDGRLLVTGGDDDEISLWDIESRQRIGKSLSGHTGDVNSVVFSPNGRMLASGSDDGLIILWDVESHQRIGEPLAGHRFSVRSVAFSPDGLVLASGSDDDTIQLWDVESRRPIGKPLHGHKGDVYSIAFSPDGRILASGGQDRTVIFWDLASRQRIGAPLAGHRSYVRSIAFSPDGKRLASTSADQAIVLWDVESRQRIVEPMTPHSNSVSSVAFSPNGQLMASGGDDKTIILWDMRTLQPLPQRLRNHTLGVVRALAFSPDSKMLVSVSWGRSIILWDLSVNSWLTRVCGTAKRNLSNDEWHQFLGDEPYRKTCQNLPIHPSIIEAAKDLAAGGDVASAIVQFQKALELDPSLDLDPEAEARRLAAAALVTKGTTLARQGKIKEAVSAYGEGQTIDPALKISFESWNTLCWRGALLGFAQNVVDACERAVTLAPSDSKGWARDSRGLARALTGHYSEAAADFEAFVTWSKENDAYENYGHRRETWIAELTAGRNPFDSATLAALRRDEM